MIPPLVSPVPNILGTWLTQCAGYIAWAYKTIADKDAVAVRILRDAGAVFYVKTANPQTLLASGGNLRGVEFAEFSHVRNQSLETNNNIWGRTLNPFNRALTPGGSSGGEGALIAMNGSPLGLGTDIGGSIVRAMTPLRISGLVN
jgi:amidase